MPAARLVKPAAEIARSPMQKPPAADGFTPAGPKPPVDQPIDQQLVAATRTDAPHDAPAAAPTLSKDDAKKDDPVVQKDDGPAKENTTVLCPAAGDPEPVPANPNGPAIRMVNTKRVSLNYELKDVGASGVSCIELWITQDGKKWKKGEIVAQNDHAFTVEVKDEGMYGFTLLPRNGAGLGKEAPQDGDQPQVWVQVDCTKPAVQVIGVEASAAAGKAPTLAVRWTAKDVNLGPKPISLFYAEQPEGPWTPIALGLENTGRFEWPTPPAAPNRLFVKVEAADLCGNVGAAQTANALRLDVVAPADGARHAPPPPPAVDLSKPAAEIRAVEPAGN
jgi:hypothetical protein